MTSQAFIDRCISEDGGGGVQRIIGEPLYLLNGKPIDLDTSGFLQSLPLPHSVHDLAPSIRRQSALGQDRIVGITHDVKGISLTSTLDGR